MRALPKAELHVHLEGTAPPELVHRMAVRSGLSLPERLVGGDGRFYYTDFLDFLRTYDLAASVMRTGEWAGADSVRAALELPITRIAHGVRAVEDPSLLFELEARGIVLDCCPTSNVVLGVYPSYESHPLPELRDAGVRVTLGSDDPPYFGATIEGEYEVCAERMGFSPEDLREVTRTA